MLADYLLALSLWVLISLTFIPIYIHIQKKFLSSEEHRYVYELFYQYLIDVQLKERGRDVSILEGNGKQYSLKWVEEGNVCIIYEDVFHQEQSICEQVSINNKASLPE